MTRTIATAALLVIVWALIPNGNALAFDEDGFRTGMTLEQVKKQLPKGVRLKGPPSRLGSGREAYFLPHEPLEKSATFRYGVFTFCHGELTGVMKEYHSVDDFLRLMKKLLVQYGPPNKIEATDEIAITSAQSDLALTFRWSALPETVNLTYVPHLPAKDKQPEWPAIVTVWYDTISPSCFGDAIRSQPVAFGSLALNE
jgi:hypothetical protein